MPASARKGPGCDDCTGPGDESQPQGAPPVPPARQRPALRAGGADSAGTTTQRGQQAEDAALRYLQARGLALVTRNYRSPGRGGGEIDLIMRDEVDGTIVFVEVRHRRSARYGGAAASITAAKQQRIIHAARHWLLSSGSDVPCRFDALLISPSRHRNSPTAPGAQCIEWVVAAFDAGEA